MKYFGTDGIRQIGSKFLENHFAYKVGLALSHLSNSKKKKVCIARDTRVTGEAIAEQIGSALISQGCEVMDLGIVPTPVLAYLTVVNKQDFGVMISASHNSPEYNGIKIFNHKGYKIIVDKEEFIESYIDKIGEIDYKTHTFKTQFNEIDKYKERIKGLIDVDLSGFKVKLDCGYGAASFLAKDIFQSLGAEVVSICDAHDGEKINIECGSTYMENINMTKDFDIGFSFDGDADRVIAIDNENNIINGDIFLLTLARYFKSQKKLHKNVVVGTTMANFELEKKLKEINVKLVRTDVGDKYVQQEMLKHKYVLGGEQSGHIILDGIVKTGDGIFAALYLLKALKGLNETANDITANFHPLEQKIENVITENKKVVRNKKVLKALEQAKKILAGNGRIILRPSGTEPKIRIMVESNDDMLVDKAIDVVKNAIIKSL